MLVIIYTTYCGTPQLSLVCKPIPLDMIPLVAEAFGNNESDKFFYVGY
jgi:hypothetical protein